MYRIDRNPVYL